MNARGTLGSLLLSIVTLTGCFSTDQTGTSIMDALDALEAHLGADARIVLASGIEFRNETVRQEWLNNMDDRQDEHGNTWSWDTVTSGSEDGFPDGKTGGWVLLAANMSTGYTAIYAVQRGQIVSEWPRPSPPGPLSPDDFPCEYDIRSMTYDSPTAIESVHASGALDFANSEMVEYVISHGCWTTNPVAALSTSSRAEQMDSVLVDMVTRQVLVTEEDKRRSGTFIYQEAGTHTAQLSVLVPDDSHQFRLDYTHPGLTLGVRINSAGPARGAVNVIGPEGQKVQVILETSLAQTSANETVQIPHPNAGEWRIEAHLLDGVQSEFSVKWCAPGLDTPRREGCDVQVQETMTAFSGCPDVAWTTPCAKAHRGPWFDGAFALGDERRHGYDMALSAAMEGRSGD